VVEFRKAVDEELADSLAAYRYRVQQKTCVQQRLAELHQWLEANRAGTWRSPAGEIGRPSMWTFRTSVWRSSSEEIMNHLTLNTRQTYASLYDQLNNADSQLAEEIEVWRNLNELNGEMELSTADQKRLSGLIYRAKNLDDLVTVNYTILLADAGALGIRPEFGDRKKHITPPNPELCRPLFQQVRDV
jgi:hypothetical protein